MSEEAVRKSVEIDYINAMLDVGQLVSSENKVSDGVLYELFSVSGFKVAVLHSEVLAILDVSEVEIVDDIILSGTDGYAIVDISCLIKSSGEVFIPNRFILLNNAIAIACEEYLGEEKIDENIVCWRTSKSKRKWLAGTIRSKNIILLDIKSLQDL